MKANASKRKIFDAVDMLSDSSSAFCDSQL